MTKEDRAFIRDNKVRLHDIFIEMYVAERDKVLFMPSGLERDTQILFVNFLKSWLYNIKIFSKVEKPGENNFI